MMAEKMDKNNFVSRIRKEFPKLSFSETKFIAHGDDHAVLILDNKLIFRFPRTESYRKSFEGEVKLLDALKSKTPLAVPEYVYLSKNKDFGGYRVIGGKEMTRKRFSELTAVRKREAVLNMAKFLNGLHGLDKKVLPVSRKVEMWSGSSSIQYRRRYFEERRKIIAALTDKKTLRLMDVFYDVFIAACKKAPFDSVVHGDLSDWHILLDARTGKIRGVIDFGDAAVGDPASDFSFFWSYGNEVVKELLDKYRLPKDEYFMERSYWYYVRYLIDDLYYASKEKNKKWGTSILQELKHRLPSLLR